MLTEPDAPGAATPAVSLVICTAGERPLTLARSLDCARAAAEAAPFTTEVLLVDNSRGGDLRIAPNGVRLIRAAWPGLSAARAVGCQLSRGRVIVFTDDDVEFPPDWLPPMVEPILDGRADIVSSAIQLSDALAALELPRLCREWLAENAADSETTRVVGAGFAFDRSMLQFGVWDPQLGAGPGRTGFGEEQLFGEMCLAAGGAAVYSSGPSAIHHADLGRVSADQFLREAQKKGRSEAYLAHHWRQESLRFARLRGLVRRRRAVAARRRLTGAFDGSLLTAIDQVQAASFATAMADLAGSPRRYSR